MLLFWWNGDVVGQSLRQVHGINPSTRSTPVRIVVGGGIKASAHGLDLTESVVVVHRYFKSNILLSRNFRREWNAYPDHIGIPDGNGFMWRNHTLSYERDRVNHDGEISYLVSDNGCRFMALIRNTSTQTADIKIHQGVVKAQYSVVLGSFLESHFGEGVAHRLPLESCKYRVYAGGDEQEQSENRNNGARMLRVGNESPRVGKPLRWPGALAMGGLLGLLAGVCGVYTMIYSACGGGDGRAPCSTPLLCGSGDGSLGLAVS